MINAYELPIDREVYVRRPPIVITDHGDFDLDWVRRAALPESPEDGRHRAASREAAARFLPRPTDAELLAYAEGRGVEAPRP